MKASTARKHLRPIACSLITGKPIMGGAFFMHDTVGLPLGVQILEAKKGGVTMSVPEFVTDARRAGWPDNRILKTIKSELVDSGLHQDVEAVLFCVETQLSEVIARRPSSVSQL